MTTKHPRPNILLIHTHDTGRYLGCYGEPVSTPHIDRLARQGALFRNYFAAAPQCSPSRASVLTGQHPHRSGMLGLAQLGWRLGEGVRTLPQVLHEEAGYETLLFGVQHEAGNGSELGYQVAHNASMPQRAAVVAPAVAHFISARDASERQAPYFASVGFWETHRPFDEEVYVPEPSLDVPPYLTDTKGTRTELAQFRGLLRAVDDGVGTILDALDATGSSRDTIVLFTSDHGVAFPRAKGTLYDAGLGIPLLMRWPGRIDANLAVDDLLSNVDLMPTLLDMVDVRTGDDADGSSFASRLGIGAVAYLERQHVFAELTWHDRYSPVRGIRTHRWKYIRHFEPGPLVYLPIDVHRSLAGEDVRDACYARRHDMVEVYDLDADPLEEHNLAGQKDVETVELELRVKLDDWMRATNDPLLAGRVPGREGPGWAIERGKMELDF